MIKVRLTLFALVCSFLPILAWAQPGFDGVVLVQNQTFQETVQSSPNQPIVVNSPQHGTLQVSATGQNQYLLTYSPDQDYLGLDEFTLEISNGLPPATVSYKTYKFNIVKSVVVAHPDYGFMYMGGSYGKPVISNDYASNPPLQLKNVSFEEGGTVSMNAQTGVINFTPDPAYSGMAHIKYTVCDSLGTCATGTFAVSVVEGAPTDGQESFGTAKNTPVSIPLGYPSYYILSQATNGIVEINDLQELTYSPNQDFTGQDSFSLTTTVNGTTTTLHYTVNVYDKKDPNQSAMDDKVFTPVNTPVTFNVLDNDYGNFTVMGFSMPPVGTLTYNGGGEYTYTPPANYTGGTSFTYRVGDMFNPNIEKATVFISVSNQAPALTTYDLTTSKETPLVIKYPTTYTEYGFELINPANSGTVTFYEGQQTVTIRGQEVSGYNMLIYNPGNGFTGMDEFEVNYCLLANGECEAVKVRVNVTDTPGGCYSDCVWPGDVNQDGVVSAKDILPIGLFFGAIGPERSDKSTDWYGHAAPDWDNPFSTFNLKHVDANGDGQITAADTGAVAQSFGQYDNLTPYFPNTNKQIAIQFGAPSVSNPQPGDFVSIPILLGTGDDPAVDIYGFTFNIDYWVDALDNVAVRYLDESWFTQNDAVLWMAKSPYNGRMETAITRTGGINASGQGIIGYLDFIIDDQIDGIKQGNGILELSIDGGEVNDAAGNRFAVGGDKTTIQINLAGTGLAEIDPSQVILYPNPASETINIHLNGGFKANTIQVFDMSGRVLFQVDEIDTNHFVLPLQALSAGAYIAKVITLDGVVNKKFTVVKEY